MSSSAEVKKEASPGRLSSPSRRSHAASAQWDAASTASGIPGHAIADRCAMTAEWEACKSRLKMLSQDIIITTFKRHYVYLLKACVIML